MIELITDYPLAYESNDHNFPHGTKNDNSTNKRFIEELHTLKQGSLNILDLGCSGGQLVVDFINHREGNKGVGIEGSDYSVKRKRANCPEYYNKNLFTADITKPFTVKNIKFDFITLWEVLEHIHKEQLPNCLKILRIILNQTV